MNNIKTKRNMKTKRNLALVLLLTITSVALASIPAAQAGDGNHTPANGRSRLSPLTEQELAQARRGTAKYHDIEQAIADGYVDFNLYIPGEGFHYLNASLLDGTFDPAHPEMLLYSPVPGEDRLELAGVEYLVPLSLSSEAPAGFTGDADQWRLDAEGFGLWELNAWIWLHNPEGIFGHDNPRVP